MTWNGPQDTPPTVRIAAQRTALLPSEQRVADTIAESPDLAVELTAQELADRIGVARTTVIRTSQSLGYAGYTQLRVALTRELARSSAAVEPDGDGILGGLQREVAALAAALPRLAATMDEASLQRAVALLATAPRVIVLGTGLSASIADDVAKRLTAVGRVAESVLEPISQQIAAVQLRRGDVALVISGSGASQQSLKAARAAAESQGTIVLVSSFARSPLAELADVTLVVGPVRAGFREELEMTSRVPHAILLEFLIARIAEALGDSAVAVRTRVLGLLSDNLGD